MTDTARPATINDLLNVIQSLNKHRVKYLLIGGYALHSHGYTRGTEDIDLLIPNDLSINDIQQLKKALCILSDQSILNVPNDAFKENIRIIDEIVIDLMTNAGGENYESLQGNVGSIAVNGKNIKTIDLKGLLKTKQTSTREKDKMDCKVINDFLKQQSE